MAWMRMAAGGLALGMLAGCGGAMAPGSSPTAPPPTPAQPPEVRLVSAIESRGCVLNGGNVGEVLLAANLTQAELTEITPRLAAAGRVEVSGEGQIRVLTERCI